ncbi:spore germination protein KC [Neobacillus niacini]|uniref:Ger(x)C family spore germination protein n=1 Tax=Neobacillus niacini TaxID=86668 RepID=UPI00278505CF|nr:Ger(x)C family spore germination protein [Neobacillus niacini]MDQ1005278.1 spore germination protein KC [Neobacillus niacini]
MKSIVSNSMKALSITCLLICLAGCWNSKELTDFGFLMGVSLDQTDEGSIELNTQVYRPMETVGGAGTGGGKPPYVTIKTVSDSIFDAARELTLYLGRKAQWSHMRVILIGEQFAKEYDIGEILDYFYRDHEARLTMLVIIVKGKAADYWEQKPFIERSMSQQLLTIIEMGSATSGKTKSAKLLDIALQLNSKVKTVLIPYIEPTKEQPKTLYSSGAAIVHKGKMVDYLSSSEVQRILMLTNEYKGGIIEFPCMNEDSEKKKKKETLETLSIKTKVSPQFTENPPTIKMLTKIEALVGELRCSSIKDEKELKKLEDHIKKLKKEEIEVLIQRFQEKKVDVLGIGNNLYQQNPHLWEKWEKDWDDIFAETQFEINVEVSIQGTGIPVGEKVAGE